MKLNEMFFQRFFRRKPARELLPTKPVMQKVIQPWWKVRIGFITEDDIKVRFMLLRRIENHVTGKIVYALLFMKFSRFGVQIIYSTLYLCRDQGKIIF